MERGPADSPQTNGLAERFNQTLLTKLRCVLAQSNIPISYWDEAAKYCSMLNNHLPSKALQWETPVGRLLHANSLIEPTRNIHCLLPFGIKVHAYAKDSVSKVSPTSNPLLFLGYEPLSDAARFLDPSVGKITASRDFSPSKLNFKYNSPDTVRKPPSTLPHYTLDVSPSQKPVQRVTVPSASISLAKRKRSKVGSTCILQSTD